MTSIKRGCLLFYQVTGDWVHIPALSQAHVFMYYIVCIYERVYCTDCLYNVCICVHEALRPLRPDCYLERHVIATNRNTNAQAICKQGRYKKS
jgi:hypothetical protein